MTAILEHVRGTIIGPMTRVYEFWRDGRRLGHGFFENDEQAERYARQTWPKCYRAGIEMRRFYEEGEVQP